MAPIHWANKKKTCKRTAVQHGHHVMQEQKDTQCTFVKKNNFEIMFWDTENKMTKTDMSSDSINENFKRKPFTESEKKGLC